MQSGQVEANLVQLNERFGLPYIPDLIARKLAGPEKSVLEAADLAFHQAEFERLTRNLEQAMIDSSLPESPSGRAQLNDLLIRTRLSQR
jgi:predicted nucleotidyltransferase